MDYEPAAASPQQTKSCTRLLSLSAMVAWSYVILGAIGLFSPLFMGFNWISVIGALLVTGLGVFELRMRAKLIATGEQRFAHKMALNQVLITVIVAAGVLYPLFIDPADLVAHLRETSPDLYPAVVDLCAALDTTPEEYFGIVLKLSALITFVIIVPLQCCITYYYYWLAKRV